MLSATTVYSDTAPSPPEPDSVRPREWALSHESHAASPAAARGIDPEHSRPGHDGSG